MANKPKPVIPEIAVWVGEYGYRLGLASETTIRRYGDGDSHGSLDGDGNGNGWFNGQNYYGDNRGAGDGVGYGWTR